MYIERYSRWNADSVFTSNVPIGSCYTHHIWFTRFQCAHTYSDTHDIGSKMHVWFLTTKTQHRLMLAPLACVVCWCMFRNKVIEQHRLFHFNSSNNIVFNSFDLVIFLLIYRWITWIELEFFSKQSKDVVRTTSICSEIIKVCRQFDFCFVCFKA